MRRAAVAVLRVTAANAAAFALVVLGVEGGTRVLGVHEPSLALAGPSDRRLWVYDATKGWFHAPHAQGQSFLGGPDRGLVRINGLGLRGPEVSRSKPPGVGRVVVLGDSFAFGVGVDEEHVLASRLERLLQADGRRFEVVNLGVSGYSTDQELVLLQELGLALAPDVVVLVACDNDFEGNTQDFIYQRYYKPYYDLERDGVLALHGTPVRQLAPAQRVKLWLAERSNVWNFVRTRTAPGPVFARGLAFFQVGVPRATAQDPVDLTFALVAAMSAAADRAGARFVVMNTGHRGEKTPLFQALRARLRRARIPFLGLEGEMGRARREEPGRRWDFGTDVHWNVDAHEKAARILHAYLAQPGVLGP